MDKYTIDDRRDLIIPGNAEQTIQFAVENFIHIAQQAIAERGYFSVALSGGSTPRSIFEGLASEKHRNALNWGRVILFWSDERCVAADHPDSNYKMAMDAGLATLPIPPTQIHRLANDGEKSLNRAAEAYEELFHAVVPTKTFDLVMLGMGDDGHTASLFPHTQALHIKDKLVAANFIPAKNSWRLTLTFPGIHASRHIVFYVIGSSKAQMLYKVLYGPLCKAEDLPAQAVGLPHHKALWIADQGATQFPKKT